MTARGERGAGGKGGRGTGTGTGGQGQKGEGDRGGAGISTPRCGCAGELAPTNPSSPTSPRFFLPLPLVFPPGPRDRTRPEVSILFLSFLSRGVFRRRQYFSHCLGVIGLPGARGDRGELARVLRRRAVRTPRHGRGLS